MTVIALAAFTFQVKIAAMRTPVALVTGLSYSWGNLKLMQTHFVAFRLNPKRNCLRSASETRAS